MTTFWIRTLGLAFGAITAAVAAGQPSQPAITGISHMCVYSGDAKASEYFYAHILGAAKGPDPQDPKGTRYYFSPLQFVEVLPLPTEHTFSRMACVAYNTQNAGSLREYLHAHDVQGVSELHNGDDGSRWFETKDPEGNPVQFLQPSPQAAMPTGAKPISTRIIHVGYLVRSRAAEDHFYKEVLGFRPYWFGAKQPNHVDWVSQQVPDGHDWLEYMLVGEVWFS